MPLTRCLLRGASYASLRRRCVGGKCAVDVRLGWYGMCLFNCSIREGREVYSVVGTHLFVLHLPTARLGIPVFHNEDLKCYCDTINIAAMHTTTATESQLSMSSIEEIPTAEDDATSDLTSSPSAVERDMNTIDEEKQTYQPEEAIEPEDMPNLPYRTLTGNASMAEYTHETPTGLQEVLSNRGDGKLERFELVMFKPSDAGNPKNWSKGYKWWCTMVVALTCFIVAFNSAVITADIEGVCEEFGVSQEVGLLSVTLFVGESSRV